MAIRLYQPPPAIEVWSRRNGIPERFRWRGRVRHIDRIEEVSDLLLDWWTANPVDRRSYRLIAGEGLVCTIFLDRRSGTWHMYAVED